MADFQENMADFEARQVAVIAASVDSLEDTQKFIAELGLTMPVAYGVDVLEFAGKTGAYYEEDKGFLHASGFILKADGTVVHAVYSTGPIGRFRATDCLQATGG